jgi:hypothetical protein
MEYLMARSLRAGVVALFALTVSPEVAAQTTWTIDDNGGADFIHIQDGVDTAQSGDVLLVRDGAYAGFTIDGKSLVVAGEPGGDVRVAAYVVVRNLAPDQKVEFDSLRIGLTFAGAGVASVTLEDNTGSVRIVDCEVQGANQTGFHHNYALGCQASDDVGVLRSSFQGGGYYYYSGSSGIMADASNLLITDSTLLGGDGSSASYSCSFGFPGGPGLSARNSSNVVCVGSVLRGGTGGLGDCSGGCYFTPCGDGDEGQGILLFAATGQWKDSTFNDQPGPEMGPFERTEFAAFCFGTWEECPCGNNGAPGAGCNTSYDSGGVQLTAAGNPSVSADTVTLSATGFRPTGFPGGLFFQGTTQAGSGMGAVFNDGLLCATGEIIRLKGKIAMSGSMTLGFGNPADQPVSVRGALPAGGGTRVYQVWYRNQAPQFCTAERFNMSNGLEITWVP